MVPDTSDDWMAGYAGTVRLWLGGIVIGLMGAVAMTGLSAVLPEPSYRWLMSRLVALLGVGIFFHVMLLLMTVLGSKSPPLIIPLALVAVGSAGLTVSVDGVFLNLHGVRGPAALALAGVVFVVGHGLQLAVLWLEHRLITRE